MNFSIESKHKINQCNQLNKDQSIKRIYKNQYLEKKQ